ncbi:hypothetical protein [Paenibacillus sp. PL2-23]|uniref:hypothetical protein n=1 Tax=Paenibacillus sp. PL2-23 TaxID=2100729 RepID=UPI0030F52F27
MKKLLTLLFLSAALVLSSCSGSTANNESPSEGESPSPSPAATPSADGGAAQPTASPPAETPTSDAEGDKASPDKGAAEPEDGAAAVIEALKSKNIEALKKLVHPEHGVRFSPYAHIDSENAVHFEAGKLPDLDDPSVFTWGVFDGSGEPIKLTFGKYYERFVYDHDYANAAEIGWDTLIGSGNTTPNLKELYPDSYLVDYHFPGFDEKYEGMDWASLILVLEQHEGSWYVSAIVHSAWTI